MYRNGLAPALALLLAACSSPAGAPVAGAPDASFAFDAGGLLPGLACYPAGVRLTDFADELQRHEEIGQDAAGRYFLVIAADELIDDASDFVETSSRTGADILAGRGRELDVYPLAKEQLTLGRGESCDIKLKHPMVSAVHARFVDRAGLLMLTDANSRHGTIVNGAPIPRGGATAVDVGDVIQFGPVRTTIWGLDDVLAAARSLA